MHFTLCHFTDEYFSFNSIYESCSIYHCHSKNTETCSWTQESWARNIRSEQTPPSKMKKHFKALNPLLYQPQHWTSYFCILPSSYLWRINKQNWIFLMSFTLLRLKLEKLASRCLPLSVPIIDYQQFSTVTVTAFPYRRAV